MMAIQPPGSTCWKLRTCRVNYSVTQENCNDIRGAQSVRARIEKILGILNTDIGHARVLLEDFFSSIGISTDIASLTDGFDPNIIIENVNTERLKNNPRVVSKSDLLTMLHIQKT
jgi:hypothetical protein